MDIQDLRIFARVAAVQNLSSVGTELGLTPGTISKRIQALESELRVRLFDRTTRSIRITEEGATFLPTSSEFWLIWKKPARQLATTPPAPKAK
jgi:Transcriptional regulator